MDRQKHYPSHYSLNNFDRQLSVYLSNWLSPQEGPFIYEYIASTPNKSSYELELTAIKWELKSGHLNKA